MQPSTDWQEQIPPGEQAELERLAERLHELQKKNAHGKKASRALHAKAHAGVEAELTVLPDLPEHARIGLFKTPAAYKALVRSSNGVGVRQPDKKPDARGFAIKVLGVPGKKIIPGMEEAKTQDLLFILAPATPFRNAHEFVGFVTAAATPALLLPKAIAAFGIGRTFQILKKVVAGIGRPFHSVATATFYSALPIKFGPYAVKLTLRPAASDAPSSGAASPDAVGEELAARLLRGPVSYDLQVQFYVDPVKTPIEDPTVEWRVEDSPLVTVARLVIPTQDINSARGKKLAEWIETLSFDPWHALEEHRPLGHLMRARNVAYRVSTIERQAEAEPDGLPGSLMTS
jgi:hypothetical protein